MTDGSFLRELFLQRLPANVRMVLASTPDNTSLEKLADLADKIMEVATPPIANVTTTLPALATEVTQLREEVSRLEKLIQKLTRSRSSSRPGRHPSRRSPTPPTTTPPASDAPNTSLCWYHQKFGDQAQRCKPPCARLSNSQAGH